MPESTFAALLISQEEDKSTCSLQQLSQDDLPQEDVLVKVSYSGINYKDALAVTGRGKVVRQFPIIPGIDLAGEVVESASDSFSSGDRVVATGWGIGEQYWGGLSQYARLKADWLLPLPEGLDERAAMTMGTAGFTAALSVLAIQDRGIEPGDGPVLVTGAGGGVGGVSVMLLSALGYEVHAVSGRESLNDYLIGLGATAILPRESLSRECRPMEKETWAAAVDSVGGQMLATLLSQIKSEGLVAACGLAAGMKLPTTVLPFILRGVTLRGINSVYSPVSLRSRAWKLIGDTLDAGKYDELVDHEISLEQVIEVCDGLLDGRVRGRIIVKTN